MFRFAVYALLLGLGALPLSAARAHSSTAVAANCAPSLSQAIPPRAADAPGGRAFVLSLQGLSDDEREAAISAQLRAGNIPRFLRHLVPVSWQAKDLDGRAHAAVVCVAPDYLAIGSDSDYLYVPMRLDTALSVAQQFGFLLPTPKLVDTIYAQSTVRLSPQPLPASDTMRTTAYYQHHNALVRAQRASYAAPLGALTAGDKKDLVITNRLWGKLERVAIYGWHSEVGQPIQPLSTVHGWHYADYSHGVRLVAAMAFVDGQAQTLLSLLESGEDAPLFSNEGAMPHLDDLLARLVAHRFTPPAVGPAIAALGAR